MFKRKEKNVLNINEIAELEEGGVRQVQYKGIMLKIILTLTVIWTVFQLYMSSFGIMDAVKFRSWHLAFLLVLAFLLYPATKKNIKTRVRPTVWDVTCIVISMLCIGYFLWTYNDFVRERNGQNTVLDLWVGGLAILMLFEASRRVVGNGLTIIAGVFLFYNFFGKFIPGILGHHGFSFERVINIMFWGGQGIYGTALGVSATYIFIFVLFGAFLKNSGFSDFINDLALTVAGRTAGGPAKVAVFASALMGTVSGSAVGNVVTTGTVTIPMMKKTGYTARFAGAVEAVASTGGLIAPPVMGAAGFIMAEFLGVSYTVVMIAAIIPAVLYYVTVFMVVHFEAKKLGLSGIARENIPQAMVVLKNGGHLLIPLVVLLTCLFAGLTPLFAAIWALFSTVVAAALRKSTRMNLSKILASIEEGARGAINVGIACAIVGVVIATISLTSIGLVVGNNVLSFAGENVLIAGILTAVISIVLGMGVPATAAYIIVAAISIPILVNMGVSPIAAHMFAFYYAALSSITPPVALASYAAAGIAGADPNKVSIESMKIGIVGFIVPFFFLFNPLLLFQGGTPLEYVVAGTTAVIGGVALASAVKGWLFYSISIIERIMMAIAAYFLIEPTMLNDVFGLVLIGVVIILQLQVKKSFAMVENNTNI